MLHTERCHLVWHHSEQGAQLQIATAGTHTAAPLTRRHVLQVTYQLDNTKQPHCSAQHAAIAAPHLAMLWDVYKAVTQPHLLLRQALALRSTTHKCQQKTAGAAAAATKQACVNMPLTLWLTQCT
jgi:hypothetical protein